jgi:hypothetical protein
MVNCKHWQDCGVSGGGCCAINAFDRPSAGVCMNACKLREAIPDWTPKQKSRGLGDTIAKITSAIGITPCGGCKARQAALNKIAPYKS